MSRDNNFDLIRLFAACQVVYMHCVVNLGLPNGGSPVFYALAAFDGVVCFFIISGFLVTASYLGSASAGRYFIKRVLRIYPALIVNIAILEFVMWLGGGLPGAKSPSDYASYLLGYAITASDWIAVTLAAPPALIYDMGGFFRGYPSGVMWSLTLELSFYLVLPLVLEVVRRHKPAGLALLLALMAASVVLAMNLGYPVHPLLDILVFRYFWIFGLGMLAYLLWPNVRPWVEGRVLLWLSGYLGLICAFRQWAQWDGIDYKNVRGGMSLAMVVVVAVLTLTLLAIAFSYRGLAHRTLRGNDLSYSIYLYHMLVVSTLIALGFNGQPYLWAVVYGSAFAVAWLSWRLVEQPCLALRDSFSLRARPRQADRSGLSPAPP